MSSSMLRRMFGRQHIAALAASALAWPALAMQSPVAVAIAEGEPVQARGVTQTTRAVGPAVVVSSQVPIDEAVHVLRARRLAIPVAGVGRDSLQDTYHDRRGVKVHEAIDIAAPRGTPIIAVDDGRIVKLFNSAAGGLTIYQFDAAQQFAYYYAHLDRYANGVREGMLVKRGELIGYVGSTGNAPPDAPHLHFAIVKLDPELKWWRGTAVNPYSVLGPPSP